MLSSDINGYIEQVANAAQHYTVLQPLVSSVFKDTVDNIHTISSLPVAGNTEVGQASFYLFKDTVDNIHTIFSLPVADNAGVGQASSYILCTTQFDLSKYAQAGGFAGGCRAFSRAFTFPFDTMKTLEQSDQALRPKKVNYFRGMILSVLSAIPANAVFFVIYYYLMQTLHCFGSCADTNSILHNLDSDSQVLMLTERIIISGIATVPQNLLKVPAEVIKQRAQLTPDIPIRDIITSAVENDNEGWLGLYRGSGAQLLRELPYNAFQMAIFEFLRDLHLPILATLDTKYAAAILGLIASSGSAILTQPADVLKTKLMTTYITNNNNSAIDDETRGFARVFSQHPLVIATQEVYQQQGWKGFYSGLLPRLGIVSVGGMVYFLAASAIEDKMP